MNKRLIVILGMHRSGTSALTRGLAVFGVSLGERLMGGLGGVNEKGFWEDEDVVSLNEQILAYVGRAWDSIDPITDADIQALRESEYWKRAIDTIQIKISGTSLLGLKDPRFCVLVPFWHNVFLAANIEPLYVIAVRNPLSVRDSLTQRNGFDSRKSFFLWLLHVVGVLANRDVVEHAVVVDYDELINDPAYQLNRIGGHFSLDVQREALDSYLSGFLEQGLRHSVYSVEDLERDPKCPAEVWRLYKRLKALSHHSDKDGLLAVHAEAQTCWAGILDMKWLFELAARYDFESQEAKGRLRVLEARFQEDARKLAAMEEQQLKSAAEADMMSRVAREQDAEIARLQHEVASHEAKLDGYASALKERDSWVASARAEVDALRASTSWQVTKPLRLLGQSYRRTRSVAMRVRGSVVNQGGVLSAVRKAARVARREGVQGLIQRVKAQTLPGARIVPSQRPASNIAFRPYYVNPFYRVSEEDRRLTMACAIHLHLYHEDLLEEICSYVSNLPYGYHVYVSVREGTDTGSLSRRISELLPKAAYVSVETVPNRGRDIGPLIVQFGERLKQYEIVGHIHSKKSPHSAALASWLVNILTLLFGPPGSDGREVAQIFNLLKDGAKIVYPEAPISISVDRSGWADNYEHAREILSKYTNYRIEDFPVVEFPHGTMFWARGDRITDFLSLPLKWADFPEEPIAHDGTIAHALERLILIMAGRFNGPCIKLCSRDSTEDFPHYEEQYDFSTDIPVDSPKILAYYLPQFHPTPENDEWHGEGFTEWTKVRSANPLFVDHYQQHIPHPDLGYYLLDSPDVLEKQASMMKKAGVYGQIFYHYWFGGRLILEKPAQMLLDNPQVDMPFCFCWANENWTRKWDGNENEILLAQDYSTQDAVGFIQYLMPFFKDHRYITVEGRPLLFVYRSSSIPDPKGYVNAWSEECKREGLPPPYVVAVLTRGATDPRDFGMDAATERVLHDWTNGGAPDITDSLHFYDVFQGRALRYDDVADFYMAQPEEERFRTFRSIVPIWDNTARYANEAYVVHGSTPEKFQTWLELLLDQSKRGSETGQQMVIVNAWNEWAEGAHLEPDTRYGYAYLNSVGRALTGRSYSALEYAPADALLAKRVSLQFPPYVDGLLRTDHRLKRRFIGCLANSTLFNKCVVECEDEYWISELRAANPAVAVRSATSAPCDFTLLVGRPSVFPPQALERMIRLAIGSRNTVVIGNSYGGGEEMYHAESNMAVTRRDAHGAPFSFYPYREDGVHKQFKVCPDARFFVAPNDSYIDGTDLATVMTIVRVHARADLNELENALLCLLAMRDCVVVPYVAAQDFSEEQRRELEARVRHYPWDPTHPPIIRHFESPDHKGDLRSVMLNEPLREVNTQYVAFLDYDDLLLPTAYGQLTHRLRHTGKAVTFGRVYASLYCPTRQRIIERRRTYEYGYSYSDFLDANHAPIHSFIVDVSKIDLSGIVWHADQKYMEDYLLTLQVFSADNCDWESLARPNYLGDYIHKDDGSNTLAVVDSEKRAAILESPLYRLCEARIMEMRRLKRSQRKKRASAVTAE
jgi:lipopolysaccharide biosynthesis protein